MRVTALEVAFWACDFVATTQGISETDVNGCGTIYDALKERKFGGDFAELHRGWQENKAARHEALIELNQRVTKPRLTRDALGASDRS